MYACKKYNSDTHQNIGDDIKLLKLTFHKSHTHIYNYVDLQLHNLNVTSVMQSLDIAIVITWRL